MAMLLLLACQKEKPTPAWELYDMQQDKQYRDYDEDYQPPKGSLCGAGLDQVFGCE